MSFLKQARSAADNLTLSEPARQMLLGLARRIAQKPIQWHRFFPAQFQSNGVDGVFVTWRRLPRVLVLSIDATGSWRATGMDTGPCVPEEFQPTTTGLVRALQWLAREVTMLIRPARVPVPIAPLAAAPPLPLPLVSVVVGCYGALEMTKGLVASLRENAGCDYELILVDDCCPQQTWKWAEQEGITYIRHTTNRGLPRSLNEGAALAKGDLIGLWNSDMLVRPYGLRRLAECALEWGIAGQSGGFFRPGGYYVDQTGDYWQADYPEGYCLVVRRDVWQDVGGWDPIYYPTNADDSDWALRARLRGHTFRLVPACVDHLGQASTGSNPAFGEVVRRHQGILRDRYAQFGLGERILVRRWGAAGDLIMATPALRALKRQFPLARLHVQCHGAAGQVLADLPYVDGVFQHPPPRVAYTKRFNLDGTYEQGQAGGTWEHPRRAFKRALGVLDEPERDLLCDLRLQSSYKRWATAVLPEGRYVAAVLRSAFRPKANWGAQQWGNLADLLPDGMKLLLLDSERNPAVGVWGRESVHEDYLYTHPNVVNCTGQTPTFMHAAALIAQCEACVSVDTGLLHAAAALRVPTFGFYGGVPGSSREPTNSAFTFAGRADCLPCQNPGVCMREDRTHCLDWVAPHSVAEELSKQLLC